MIRRESSRKRTESGGRRVTSAGQPGVVATDVRTEDELLRRRQHVQREGDLVLVALALEPAEQRGRVQHCGEDEGGEGDEQHEGDDEHGSGGSGGSGGGGGCRGGVLGAWI
jgi:uncharacterized membrane protein YgcG